MTTKRIDIPIYAQDANAKTKINDLKAKLDTLKNSGKDILLSLDDEKAKLKVRDMLLDLAKLSRTVSKPSISLEGFDRASLKIDKLKLSLKELNDEANPSKWEKFTNILSGLGSSGGWRPSKLLSGEAAEGSEGILPALSSPVGVGVIGGIGSLVGALIPALAGGGLGLGVGGAGLYGSYKETPGMFSGLISGITSALKPIFSGSTEQGRSGNRVGGTMTNTSTSLGASFEPMLNTIGKFISSEGPALQQMFRASVPLVSEFAKELMPVAKQIIPELTSVLKQSGPAVTALAKSFGILLQDSAKALQYMAPAFKASGTVLVAVSTVIGDTIKGLGATFGWLARQIAEFGNGASKVVRDVEGFFSLMTSELIADGKATINGVIQAWDKLPAGVRHAADEAVNDLKSIFGHLGNLMFGWGRDAISSLISGLRSIGVGSAITTIGHALGIPSFHFAQGGIITEPVVGMGLRTGASYSFGEIGPERVTPAGTSSGGDGDVYQIFVPQTATDPDAFAREVVQSIRNYKRHIGQKPVVAANGNVGHLV